MTIPSSQNRVTRSLYFPSRLAASSVVTHFCTFFLVTPSNPSRRLQPSMRHIFCLDLTAMHLRSLDSPLSTAHLHFCEQLLQRLTCQAKLSDLSPIQGQGPQLNCESSVRVHISVTPCHALLVLEVQVNFRTWKSIGLDTQHVLPPRELVGFANGTSTSGSHL